MCFLDGLRCRDQLAIDDFSRHVLGKGVRSFKVAAFFDLFKQCLVDPWRKRGHSQRPDSSGNKDVSHLMT